MTLALSLLAFALGYLAGWLRRDRTVGLDTLDWWQKGWTAALESCGHNPLKKRVRFSTIDDLTGTVNDRER